VFEARRRNLVTSFLTINIKGFFDHTGHERLLDVLSHLGFHPTFVKWVGSFLSEHFVRVQVDNYVGDPHPQMVGYPQGSPISPILACIFASLVLERLNADPIFDATGSCPVPVCPSAYVDDFEFHASSTDLSTSTHLLKCTLDIAVDTLSSIGLTIDPDKCDLMHFSWRKGDNSNPTLKTVLYGKEVSITPPKSLRWLGFHLDRKLTFREHINKVASKGLAIIQGMEVLGNTVEGISPANLRLLYNTVIIPVITYGPPFGLLWTNPKPSSLLPW